MNSEVAEGLLTAVMEDPVEVEFAEQLSILRSLATYKYDEYQQYAPGRQFIAYLAGWLEQFQTLQERRNALRFIQERLVFISDLEMRHLVSLMARDHVPAALQRCVAKKIGIPEYRVAKVRSTPEFNRAQRASLFLGMSDGARIDQFRRNRDDRSNEQFAMTHELNQSRVDAMLGELRDDLNDATAGFEYIFLVDDFAGSGRTIMRHDDGEPPKGRLVRFAHDTLPSLATDHCPQIFLALYVSTDQAVEYLTQSIAAFDAPLWTPDSAPQVLTAMTIDDRARLTHDRAEGLSETDQLFDDLLHKYYNDEIEDMHKGNVLHGYADCGLPLVLNHNTPNNSVYLLWEAEKTRPLFPRFQRHQVRAEAA